MSTYHHHFILPTLLLTCGVLSACSTPQTSAQSSTDARTETIAAGGFNTTDRIVEAIALPTPAEPNFCSASVAPNNAPYRINLYIAPDCSACNRQLQIVREHKDKLANAGIEVVANVIHVDGSCMDATRLAGRWGFPFRAYSSDDAFQWGVRSTPTLWVVNKETNMTQHYVEGEIDVDELISLVHGSSSMEKHRG